MNFKSILVILAFTPMAVLAANSPKCIPPSSLNQAAHLGLFHSFKNVKSCKDVKLYTWYLDDSATPGSFKKELNELKKYNDWKVGPYGSTNPNGYGIKCDYYSPSLTGDDVLTQMLFSRKGCNKK